jgi:hypothetical protein
VILPIGFFPFSITCRKVAAAHTPYYA